MNFNIVIMRLDILHLNSPNKQRAPLDIFFSFHKVQNFLHYFISFTIIWKRFSIPLRRRTFVKGNIFDLVSHFFTMH